MAVPREAVVWAYRLLLDREPDSEAAIEENESASLAQLVAEMLASDEFLGRNAERLCVICEPRSGREGEEE